MEAIVYIFPNFQNWARCGKDLKDNKHTILHLGRKYINNSRHFARKDIYVICRPGGPYWEKLCQRS